MYPDPPPVLTTFRPGAQPFAAPVQPWQASVPQRQWPTESRWPPTLPLRWVQPQNLARHGWWRWASPSGTCAASFPWVCHCRRRARLG